MRIPNPTLAEVKGLIRQLESDNPMVVDMAMKLLILCSRKGKVHLLIDGLKNTKNPQVKSHIIFILEGMRDKEIISPLCEMLKDESSIIRAKAAKALSVFQDQEAIPFLNDVIEKDDELEIVKQAALLSLGELLKANFELAKEKIIEVACNIDEDENLRIKAIKLLEYLGDTPELRSLIKKLAKDKNAKVYAAVVELETSFDKEIIAKRKKEIENLIKEVLSEDFKTSFTAITKLSAYGQEAAELLLDRLVLNPTDAEIYIKSSFVLKEIGRVCSVPLKKQIDKLGKIERMEDVICIQYIADLASQIQDKILIAPLIRLLERIDRHMMEVKDEEIKYACEDAKEEVHFALASLDSHEALNDLLSMVGTGKRISIILVQSLAKIGDKRALVPLIKQYIGEKEISSYAENEIKKAFKQIINRCKVAITDSIFDELDDEEKVVLHKLFAKRKSN